MSRLIKRDPFARQELHRESTGETGECDWCGQERRLFIYVIETDGGSRSRISGEFCCKACMNAYHNRED